MKLKANPNAEKIRNSLNKLQKATPILSSLQKLKFKIPDLYFEFYKNHISKILSICDKNLIFKLSWRLFQFLYEGTKDFQDYSKEKEKEINTLIEIIEEKKNEITIKEEIINKASKNGIQFQGYFIDLMNILEYLNIDKKLIKIFALFILNNDFSLAFFINELIPVLKNKYPKSFISINNILRSNISFRVFIEEFREVAPKLDNYTKLIWEENKNKFKIITMENMEIINELNSDDDKNAKKQKKNKESNKNKINNNICQEDINNENDNGENEE